MNFLVIKSLVGYNIEILFKYPDNDGNNHMNIEIVMKVKKFQSKME